MLNFIKILLTPNMYSISLFMVCVVTLGLLMSYNAIPEKTAYTIGIILGVVFCVPAVVLAVYNWIKYDILKKW